MKTLIVFITFVVFIAATKLEERYIWNEIDYEWPSQQVKNEQLQTGRYIPENNLPLGLEIWRNKLFVTVPRWKAGVASSLNYIDLTINEKSPKLRPYPNWAANRLPIEITNAKATHTAGGRTDAAKPTKVGGGLQDNSTIISTFRVSIDNCNRLWVMDTGLTDILGSPNQITPPAIVIFDLETDQLLRRFTIPSDQIKEDTFFANVVIDTDEKSCENTYAYIPDLGAYGLVVYSFRDNKSWRVKHNYFHFDPLNGNFDIDKVNFQWTDGVFGLAVGKKLKDGSKNIYFHALASNKEFYVSNRVLQDEKYVTTPAAYFDFRLLGDRGEMSQSSAEVYDPETDVIFYTQLNRDSIGCWNTKYHDSGRYNNDTLGLVDSDSVALVFPNDLKVDVNGYLWVLSDRMPTFIYKEMNKNEINYRILVGRTIDIIKGTPCYIE